MRKVSRMKAFHVVLSSMFSILIACSHQSSSPQKGTPTPNLSTIPLTQRTPEQIRETENRLFGLTSSVQECAEVQRAFLDQDVMLAFPRGSTAFLTAAPVVGHYEEGHEYAPVFPSEPIQAIQFPREFYQNIPAEIRETVSQYDVQELDLFLIIQRGAFFRHSENVSLKAHVWAHPHLGTFFPGEVFDRNLLMGIFLPDHDLSREVPIHGLSPFRVYLHDSRFSPNTARIRFHDESLSFWSVIIDEVTRRAAVTLHLLLQEDHVVVQHPHVRSGQEYTNLMFYFNRHARDRSGQSSHVNETLNGMMNRLRTDGASLFHGTPLMEKLESLLRVVGT